jgi:hypothetical protein
VPVALVAMLVPVVQVVQVESAALVAQAVCRLKRPAAWTC